MRSAHVALAAWILALVAGWFVFVAADGTPAETMSALLRAAARGPWAAPALLAAYALRSLLFLPMTVLTVFAGFLLGPWAGAAVALVGGVGSAIATYALARWVRTGTAASAAREAPARLTALRSRPFEAVLVSRLAAVPGDLVNVVAGAWRVPLGAFVGGTALGGLPGILAGVFAGASIEGAFAWRGVAVDGPLVAASVAMLVVSLAASAWVRRRGRGRGVPERG